MENAQPRSSGTCAPGVRSESSSNCAAKGWRGVVMADQEYKKFDSQAGMWMQNARLAKDPQIIEGGDKPMVKLTVVLTSRSERHADTWLELTVNDRQAEMCSYFQAKDTFGWEGFPASRVWEDKNGNERVSFENVRVEVFPSIELIMKCKERGWVPGGAKDGKAKKGAAKGAKKSPPKGKRAPVDLDAEDLEG